ncbi:MAG: outer membrane lipoprotein-sorting protein [Bacteroidetes bacterium]|nr:MAG: outer membrane lipoprotein-sorting protein [Bacteroidota bacterium]
MRSYLIILLLLFSTVSLHGQTAREISDKAADVMELSSMEMVSTLKIYDQKGRVRVREIATATRKFGDVSKTMIKFLSPADVKGTAMLVYDYENEADDMWIYLPALRKTRRIVSQERGKSFMGSEFTNADMSKPDMDDFTYKKLSKETYEGKLCWKIESLCKNEDIADEHGFSKRISWIEENTLLVYRIEFYDSYGELHKVQYIKDYKKQANGKHFAFYMEKENVQNGRKSVMTVNKFQSSSAMKEGAFAPAMLNK